jgi:hypothetical protein
MRWGIAGLILFFIGCHRENVGAVLGEIRISPSTLQFERTFIGFPTQQSLVLHNGSRADQQLTLSGTAPFSVAETLSVPGGAETTVRVTFEPTVEGSAQGIVTLSNGSRSVEIPLIGEGALPPVCPEARACRLSAFDPLAQTCVETHAPDGDACADACVKGSCSGGACVGTQTDCQDHDACTLDACDPTRGCVHFATSCSAGGDPCKAGICDSVKGCLTTDVPDGTSCGPNDCVTAKVCILGQCKALPVPDGATCSPATVCQTKGTCRQGQCDQPPAQPLLEAWSYAAPTVIGFRGVTDASNNLYWIECTPSDVCSAVSYTRAGVPRFKQVIDGSGAQNSTNLRHLLATDHLVFALKDTVGSVSAITGAPEWSFSVVTFLDSLPNQEPGSGPGLKLNAMLMAADAAGTVHLLVQLVSFGSVSDRVLLFSINPASGMVDPLFRSFPGNMLGGLILDEQGNLYFAVTSGSTRRLFSLNPSGTERWHLDRPRPSPLAVFNGELLLRSGEVLSSVNGSHLTQTPAGTGTMSVGRRTLIRSPCDDSPDIDGECFGIAIGPVTASDFPSSSSNASWTTAFSERLDGQWAWEPLATRQGGTLVATRTGTGGLSALVGLDSRGGQRFSCPLAPTSPAPADLTLFDSSVALLDGRWAVLETTLHPMSISRRLRVFELPGESAALRGWVSSAGGPSGACRPLP